MPDIFQDVRKAVADHRVHVFPVNEAMALAIEIKPPDAFVTRPRSRLVRRSALPEKHLLFKA